MAKAYLCKCGHLASDHLARTKKHITKRRECEWDDCDCTKYTFKNTMPANYKNNYAQNLPESMIEQRPEKLELPEYKRLRPKPMLIADCTPEGFGTSNIYEKPPKFNNGEYP